MNAKVIRKELDGTVEAFEFSGTSAGGKSLDTKSCRFLVKNFTENAIYVDFEEFEDEDDAIKIPANTAQVCLCQERGVQELTDTIYVLGTGEVEVQAL